MRSIDSAEIGALFFDSSSAVRIRKRVKQPKEFTEFDQMRLDAAAVKRARKAAKRLRDWQGAGERAA